MITPKKAKPNPNGLGSGFLMAEDGTTVLCSICEKPVGEKIANNISINGSIVGNRAYCAKCYSGGKQL
jgi:hypothetical protein